MPNFIKDFKEINHYWGEVLLDCIKEVIQDALNSKTRSVIIFVATIFVVYTVDGRGAAMNYLINSLPAQLKPFIESILVMLIMFVLRVIWRAVKMPVTHYKIIKKSNDAANIVNVLCGLIVEGQNIKDEKIDEWKIKCNEMIKQVFPGTSREYLIFNKILHIGHIDIKNQLKASSGHSSKVLHELSVLEMLLQEVHPYSTPYIHHEGFLGKENK